MAQASDLLTSLYQNYVLISELWVKEFVQVWKKMSYNGYKKTDLIQGPKGFWLHLEPK